MTSIENKIHEYFKDQLSMMHSDDNSDQYIIRLRFNDVSDEEEETACMYLKDFEDKLLHDLTLKGIYEIQKVTFSKYMENVFDA